MILFRKTLRTMLENKAQYLGAFLMVLISSMLMVAMTLVAANLENLFNIFSSNNQLADAEFSLASEMDLKDLPERFNAVIEQSSLADYELNPGQTLRIFSANKQLNRHAILEGSDLGSQDILIDPLFAAANNLKTGDSLQIGGQSYKISGKMALPNYLYIIRSKEEMINTPQTFGVAVLDRQDLENLANKSDYYTVRFNSRQNIHEQELLFKNYLLTRGLEITRWESTQDNPRVSFVALEVQTLSTMSKAVPGTLLALSVILIAIVLKRMIQREAVVLGSLYALGYRKTELLRHYLTFPLLVASAGGILGALLGLAIVKPMVNFFMTVFTMPVTVYRYDNAVFLVGLLAPVLVLCLTSYVVIVSLLRISPAELMKGGRLSARLNFIERALNLERFNFNTKFQIREQVRSLARTGFLLFGVIVATILLLYGLTLQSSLDYMLQDGISSLYNLKFEYIFKELRVDAPPTGFEQFNTIRVTSPIDKNSNFYVVGALPESTRIRLKDRSGKKIIPDRVVITKMLADKLRVGVGDEIEIVNDIDLKAYTLTIEAIADSSAGEFVFMPLEKLNAQLGLPAKSYIGIWGDQQLQFPAGVLRSTKSMDAVAAGIKNLIDQTSVLVYMLTISAFVVGLIIIFLVTGMVIEENRITISLFKVFGYRAKEVNQLILDSNTLVVILGYLIGVPILLATITALLQSLAGSMQMTIPARLNGWYLLFGLIVVMFTYQVAKFFSRRKIERVPISEALKAGTE